MTFLLLVFWPMAAWGWFARIPQAPLPATLAMLLAPFLGGAMSYAVVAMANRDTDFPILEFDRQTRQLKHLGKVVGRLDDIKCILFLNAPCHLKARHPHEDIDLHFEIKLLFRESLQRESILIHREEFENPEKHVAVRDFAKQAGVTCLHAAARKSNFNFVITVLN